MGSNNDNDASVSCTITEGRTTESGVAINVEPETVVEYMNSDNNIIGEYEVVIDADQCPRPEDNSIPCLGMRFRTADDAYTWIRHTSEQYAENLSGACVDGNGIFSSLVDGADGIENVGYIQQNLFDHQTFEIQDTFANEDPNIAQEMQKNNSQCNVINGLLFNQGLTSGAEKQRKGTKSCSICKGHDHNKRKCPTLKGIGHSQQPESDAHLHLSDSHLQIGDSDLHMDDSHPHMLDTHHPHLSDSQEHMSDSHPGFCALSLWNDKHTSDVMSNQAVKQLFGWVVTDDGEDFRVCSELLPTEV
ncbi:hypothetical protein AAC387_Pa04g2405 [Persea americana]